MKSDRRERYYRIQPCAECGETRPIRAVGDEPLCFECHYLEVVYIDCLRKVVHYNTPLPCGCFASDHCDCYLGIVRDPQ